MNRSNVRSTIMRNPEPATQPKPRTTSYDRKLERVLAGAARVFARDGYGSATIREVARETSMSLAGLYHYFSSKEELLFLVQMHAFEAILAGLEEVLAGVEEPEARLRVLVANHLEHFLEHMDELKVCAHEMESLSGDYYERVEELRRRYFRVALDMVTSLGTVSGARAVDARLATLYLFGMLNWIYMWYPAERNTPAEVLGEELVALFLNGFLPRGGSDPAGEKRRAAHV
jgi:AcrR family transcriptional regulator